MSQRVWEFADGSALEFDRGRFDDFCVYEVRPDGSRSAPRDTEYFGDLLGMASAYGSATVYEDFVGVYDTSAQEATPESTRVIETLAARYGRSSEAALRTFLILHMGMIAENVKKNTRLGKRIKRLGVHVLLMEGYSPEEAANFMRGRGWRDIAQMCDERGF